ncbi:hypothetical protein [Micromonospora sp. LOL_024]|uniref:hypothetical protein n=1 Tax=Micromonospora sp. LOL_024 TaxID=3345412 RepID=UPI003A8BA79C
MAGQGLAAAGAGALSEVLAPGAVMAVAGAASAVATLLLWPILTPSRPSAPAAPARSAA